MKLWGVRGSRATDDQEVGGATTCIEMRAGSSTRLVFDGGTGIIAFGNTLFAELAKGPVTVHLFLTHLHTDHWEGLRFFDPLHHPNLKLVIWGRKGLVRMLRKQMFDGNSFPVTPDMLKADITCMLVEDDGVYVIPTPEGKNVVVHARSLNHPGGCFGYRVEYDGASAAIIQDHEEQIEDTPEAAQLERNLVELVSGVDLVAFEVQYSDDMYFGRDGPSRKGWGHDRVGHAAKVLELAAPKAVKIVHADPDRGNLAFVTTIASAVQKATGIPTTPGIQGEEVTCG